MTLLACSAPFIRRTALRRRRRRVHRTACLPEIDCLESGRCPAHGPKAPLGFLNEVEQRVCVLISRGQRRGARAIERGKRGDQVTPMVARPGRRAQAAHAFGRFANSFASASTGA
jgi:hypothetical protein